MTAICKTLFDISFYYTLGAFYLYLFTGVYPSAWGVPVLTLSICLYVAIRNRRSGAESTGKTVHPETVICCVLPGLLPVFDHSSIWQILLYLPVWVFFAFTIWTNRIYTNRREFILHFQFTGKILAFQIIVFFVLFLSVSRMWGAVSGAIPYLILYLLAGVCLMRILREEGKLTTGRHIYVLLALLLGSAALAILQAPSLILNAAGFIYQNIISWILIGITLAFGAVFYGIVWIISRLFSSNTIRESTEIEAIESYAEMPALESYFETPPAFPAWLQITATILLAIASALIVFFIMRKLLGTKPGGRKDGFYKDGFYTEECEALNNSDRIKKDRLFRPKTPREAIRWFYRKYLNEGVSRGGKLFPADTSLTARQKFASFFPGNEAEKLRDLYLTARYRFSKDPSKADVNAASDIWRVIKTVR